MLTWWIDFNHIDYILSDEGKIVLLIVVMVLGSHVNVSNDVEGTSESQVGGITSVTLEFAFRLEQSETEV